MGMAWILLFMFVLIASRIPPSSSDPDDQTCLSHIWQSVRDPQRHLQNWTEANFASACSGFYSFLVGATCNNGRIYKLSLSGLGLTGSISPFISKCSDLQSLDLSSNALSGPIPPEIQSLVNLAVLNLSVNTLSGPIPPQISACTYLNVIDLHGNALSGQIPPELGLLARLSTLDVSDNHLSGSIPPTVGQRSGLPRFNATSFQGNRGLYGYPLAPMRSKGLSVMAIVGIGLGSGLASLVLSFTAVCVWLRVSERRMAAAALEDGKMGQLPDY